jgi:hypothetical protein
VLRDLAVSSTNILAAKRQELSFACERSRERMHLELMEVQMAVFVDRHTDYGKFLYAVVVESEDLPITVVSMLTRLDLDPWLEAARLAQLPRQEAIDWLSDTIQRFKTHRILRHDAVDIATKLLEHLPTKEALVVRAIRQETLDFSSMWLIFAIFFSMMAFSQSVPRPDGEPPAERGAAQTSEPAILHHDGPRKRDPRSIPPIHIQH